MLLAFNKERFSEGRPNKKDVELKKIFCEIIKEFIPILPEQAYHQDYEKLNEKSCINSLAKINFEKRLLLPNGIPVMITTSLDW
jgi:myo-inositol-1-phosphate synthase